MSILPYKVVTLTWSHDPHNIRSNVSIQSFACFKRVFVKHSRNGYQQYQIFEKQIVNAELNVTWNTSPSFFCKSVILCILNICTPPRFEKFERHIRKERRHQSYPIYPTCFLCSKSLSVCNKILVYDRREFCSRTKTFTKSMLLCGEGN